MRLSIYSSAFNIISSEIDIKDTLDNFTAFADEVVISTLNDADNSYEILNGISCNYKNLKIILSDKIPFTPEFDGAIKNDALQKCSSEIMIGLDADERIRLKDKGKWLRVANFLNNTNYDCIMCPVINFHGSIQFYSSIGHKWYIHKNGCKRGVVNFARRSDGTHDINKSDSCELLTHENNLVKSFVFDLPNNNEEKLSYMIDQDIPYVYHLGYADLHRRIKINDKFWEKQWSAENGSNISLPKSIDDLEKPLYKYNFPLWNE